ncbi:MAG: hypothetical protein U1F34_08950 [Gammaproteobacteria bacterium]
MRRITTSFIAFSFGAVLCAVFSMPVSAGIFGNGSFFIDTRIASASTLELIGTSGSVLARAAPRIAAAGSTVNPYLTGAVAAIALIQLLNSSNEPQVVLQPKQASMQDRDPLHPGQNALPATGPGFYTPAVDAVECDGLQRLSSASGALYAAYQCEKPKHASWEGSSLTTGIGGSFCGVNGNCLNYEQSATGPSCGPSGNGGCGVLHATSVCWGDDTFSQSDGLCHLSTTSQAECGASGSREQSTGACLTSPSPQYMWPLDGVPVYSWDPSASQWTPHPFDPDARGTAPGDAPPKTVPNTTGAPSTIVTLPSPVSPGGIRIDQKSSDAGPDGNTQETHNGLDVDKNGNVVNTYNYFTTYNNSNTTNNDAQSIELPTDYARENTLNDIKSDIANGVKVDEAGVPQAPPSAQVTTKFDDAQNQAVTDIGHDHGINAPSTDGWNPLSWIPSAGSCESLTFSIPRSAASLIFPGDAGCVWVERWKLLVGWCLAVWALWQIYELATKPPEGV